MIHVSGENLLIALSENDRAVSTVTNPRTFRINMWFAFGADAIPLNIANKNMETTFSMSMYFVLLYKMSYLIHLNLCHRI